MNAKPGFIIQSHHATRPFYFVAFTGVESRPIELTTDIKEAMTFESKHSAAATLGHFPAGARQYYRIEVTL